MNKQEIFDYVSKHLLAQGRKSMIPDTVKERGEVCAYRSEDGASMCAVGCLIREEDYHPNIEGDNVGDSQEVQARLRNNNIDVDDELTMSLLNSLQVIHDELDVHQWSHALRNLAEDCKLKFNGQVKEKQINV